MKWGQKQRRTAPCAVVIPKHLLPQRKIRGHPLDYLSANDAGLCLPTALKSYVDGRLGQMEDRMSSLLYKQAVEQDMVAGILADAYQFSEEDLKRRRAESISNVKKTNGRVSLDQRVREVWEEGDEWQD